VTVPGRVSDIWRSFAAQGLLKKLDLSVGYLPRPLVVQERNNVIIKHPFNLNFFLKKSFFLAFK